MQSIAEEGLPVLERFVGGNQNVRLGFGLSTHAVIMESGRIKSEGSPQALLNDPQMARLYLGGTAGSSPSAES